MSKIQVIKPTKKWVEAFKGAADKNKPFRGELTVLPVKGNPPAVIPASPVLKGAPANAEPVPPGDVIRAQADSILTQVASDMNIAELGKFYALRAGIGLLAVKHMVPHGGWLEIVRAKFPNRSERTIQMYQKDADEFLKGRGLKVGEAWRKISEIDETLLRRAAARLLLGPEAADAIPLKQIPPVVRWMGEYLIPEEPEEVKEKPEPVTPEQKMEAQTNLAKKIAGDVDEWMRRGHWVLVEDCAVLQAAADSLSAAADKLTEIITCRKRKK